MGALAVGTKLYTVLKGFPNVVKSHTVVVCSMDTRVLCRFAFLWRYVYCFVLFRFAATLRSIVLRSGGTFNVPASY